MASGRRPGPIGFHRDQPNIKDGTLCLRESPKPGPLGVDPVASGMDQSLGVLITEALLHAVMPRLSTDSARNFVIPLLRYLDLYKINTLRRISAFLGQVAVESAEFSRLEENLHYTHSERLSAIFPKHFKTAEAAHNYVKNPEKLANLIYSSKNGNGDVKSGEGWKYRGRGLIQLTGRDNYAAFSNATGIDALHDPDLLTKPEYAVYSSAWYWNDNKLNNYADIKGYSELTKCINKACLHFSEREMYRKRAAQALLRIIVTQGA